MCLLFSTTDPKGHDVVVYIAIHALAEILEIAPLSKLMEDKGCQSLSGGLILNITLRIGWPEQARAPRVTVKLGGDTVV